MAKNTRKERTTLPPPSNTAANDQGQDAPAEKEYAEPPGMRYLRERNDRLFSELRELRLKEEIRNTVILEFSDSVVIVRDGGNHIIGRFPIGPGYLIDSDRKQSIHWTTKVGEIMAARGAKNVSTRIAENAFFTIREAKKSAEEVERKCNFAGEGMKIDKLSEHTTRSIEE